VTSFAQKQRGLQFIFEQSDLAANGGMRDEQACGSIRETPKLCNRFEHLQLANVHIPLTGTPFDTNTSWK
jgi:hypothetical protein